MQYGQPVVYGLGVTLVDLVAGATPTLFIPGAFQCGYLVTKQAGSGGTLALANSFGASSSNSYRLGDTEHLEINGPAKFYLCAGGATCTAAIVIKYSDGYSSIIAGG